MSSILKALKKLEHDKASYHPDELKIDAEILRTDSSSRFSTSRVMVASLLLLAGGSGATYLYMNHDRASERTRLNTPVIAVSKVAPVSGTSGIPDIKTEQLPPAIEIVPAQPGKNVTAKIQAHNVSAVPAKTPRSINTQKPAQLNPVSGPGSNGKTPEAINNSAPSSVSKVIPPLRVSGIAYQGEGADSVAMINGVPLSRGEVINGVKIEEIHKTMVRFSYNGEKFDIPLGQSNK